MMIFSSLFCTLLVLWAIPSVQGGHFGDLMVAWCDNAADGTWRDQLAQTLASIRIPISQVDCGDIKGGVAIAIIDKTEGLQVLQQSETEEIEDFISKVMSSISSYRFLTILQPEQFESLSAEYEEYIVAFIAEQKSSEYQLFSQAALSPSIPTNIPIAIVHHVKLLPSKVRSSTTKKLRLWTIRHGIWCQIYLQDHTSSNEMRLEMTSYMKRLSYQPHLEYSGGKYDNIYSGSGLRYVIVFHRSNQLNQIMEGFILPLIDQFRPYFVFITVDGDKYSEKMAEHYLNAMTELPYIIIFGPGDSNGIHINSEYIPYTIESLSNLLKSLVDPDINNHESPPPRDGISLSFIDISALNALAMDDTPMLVILCEKKSKDCPVLHDKMKKAIDASLSSTREKQELVVFIVEVEHLEDVQRFSVYSLPSLLIKIDHKFIQVKTDFKVSSLINNINANTRKIVGDASVQHEPMDATGLSDFYDQFDELREDESSAFFYSKLTKHHKLNHLTTDNVTIFINISKNCLIAFYVPYCLQCRPMLLHLSEVSEKLRDTANMSISLVNCAEYPDLCDLFNVTVFPTIKFRKEGGVWEMYENIVSPQELLNTFTGHSGNKSTYENILEMTPPTLVSLLQSSPDLSTLLLYCTNELTPHEIELLSQVTQYQIYWLNSFMYPRVADAFVGKGSLPLLVWVDYERKSVYHFHIKGSTHLEDIHNFFTSVEQGHQPVNNPLKIATWIPFKPAIKFPSGRYLHLQELKGKKQEHSLNHDNNNEALPPDALNMHHRTSPPRADPPPPPTTHHPPPPGDMPLPSHHHQPHGEL